MKKDQQLSKSLLPVIGMSCAACASSVESMLNSVNGVNNASVSFASETVSVDYNSKDVSLKDLKDTIQSIGYDLIIEEEEEQKQKAVDSAKSNEYKVLLRKTISSIIFTIPIMIISMVNPELENANIIMMALTIPVLFWSGHSFYTRAFLQLRHKMMTMDTLVSLSTGIAFVYSIIITFFPSIISVQNNGVHVYYESAAVIISFVLFGKLLEELAKSRTSSAIKQLMSLQPEYVDVIDENGKTKSTSIKSIYPGVNVLVRPGDQIPIDGKVLSGSSYINESMISGEPIPVIKEKGSKVFAGTINQEGSLTILAETKGSETVLSKIVELVKKAQGSKADVQKLTDKIAGVFVPIVIGIAILTFVVWMIFGGNNNLSYALLTSISVLVIACPCALGLATPTAIMVGMGRGAQNQILIKDAIALEGLASIDTIVFDKTGTITEGKPKVVSVDWHQETGQEEWQTKYGPLINKLESYSTHPLSKAISEHFPDSISNIELTKIKNIPGRGIQAMLDSERLILGSSKFLKDSGIDVLTLDKIGSNTQVYFALGNTHIATMHIADIAKENAREVISSLKESGLNIWMLTGDNENSAKSMAELIEIEHYSAELLPHEKSDIIRELKHKGHKVAMVGDGINDSEALAVADIGIAMGSGSDIAMDVAQVTLRSNNLALIEKALGLSQQTNKTIKQNLFWAFIYNLIGIPIAAGILYGINGFLLNPMFAAMAMALSSVSVVTNSLLLKRRSINLKSRIIIKDNFKEMTTHKFKTNINCNGCIAAVTPKLEAIGDINSWAVDIDNPDKILTVEISTANPIVIKEAVESAGFTIQEAQ